MKDITQQEGSKYACLSSSSLNSKAYMFYGLSNWLKGFNQEFAPLKN